MRAENGRFVAASPASDRMVRSHHVTAHPAPAKPPPVPPDRLALRQAIADHQAAIARLEALQAATSKAEDALIDAGQARRRAEADLRNAEQPGALVDALLSDAPGGTSTVDAAHGLAHAEAAYRRAAQTRDAVRVEIVTQEGQVRIAAAALKEAITAVVSRSSSTRLLLLQYDARSAKGPGGRNGARGDRPAPFAGKWPQLAART